MGSYLEWQISKELLYGTARTVVWRSVNESRGNLVSNIYPIVDLPH